METLLRKLCRGNCAVEECAVETVSWKLCHGNCAVETVSWKLCCGNCAVETVLWKLCCGKCAVENVPRKIMGPKVFFLESVTTR